MSMGAKRMACTPSSQILTKLNTPQIATYLCLGVVQ